MLNKLILAGVIAAPTLSSPAPQDWPQWRGPSRDGISRETEWSSTGQAEPMWSKQVGLGYSSVSISQGRLYTCGYDEEGGGDVVLCLDAVTGEEIWRHGYAAEKWAKFHGGGTNSTPSVDGDDVYVFNREGNYTLLDAETGEVRWTINLKEEYDLKIPTWGFAASPLILDDMVVLNVGKVLAFQKGKTKLRWKSDDYGHAYSTPSACTLAGKACLAVMGGKQLVIINASNGKELGTFPWKTQYDVNATSPVVIDDERLWISSGYNHGGALVRFDGRKIEEVWATKRMRNKMSTSLLIDGHLYGLDEKVLRCFDLEGNEKWSQKDSIGQGAMSAAGDRILIHTSRGELAVVKANPEAFEELSRTKVTSSGVCWSMPILADGRIYMRSSKGELVARDHRLGE